MHKTPFLNSVFCTVNGESGGRVRGFSWQLCCDFSIHLWLDVVVRMITCQTDQLVGSVGVNHSKYPNAKQFISVFQNL